MSFWEALAIVGVGFAAGAINAIVGSGSLITFPTLVALGYAPVVANVSNTIGLAFGSISGAIGYRRELRGQRDRLRVLAPASFLGGLTGGILLLTLPSSVFDAVVPALILLACALVVFQPRLSAWIVDRRRVEPRHGGLLLLAGVYLTAIYGGYFGAAQGVILLSLLGIFLVDDLQRLNGAKNVLAAVVNGTAAVLFAVSADVAWDVAGLLAVASIVGGQVGALLGRRIPRPLLRTIIVVVGIVAAVKLVLDP